MALQDDLYALIKSLSKPEKRFFKIRCEADRNESSYLKLFEYLEKEKHYNEKEFKRKYSEEPFIRNYSYNKNYLYGLLLESLNGFNSGKYVDIQLREMISGYEVLMKKGLLHQAKKQIDRAYKISIANEKQYYTLLLNTCRINLKNMITQTDERNRYIEEIMNAQNELLDTIRNQNQYYMLSTRIMTFMNTKGSARNEKDRSEIHEILSNPLLSDINSARTLDDKCYFYFTLHLCYLGLNDLKNAYDNSKAAIALLSGEDPESPLMRGRFRTAFGSHLLLLRYFPEKTDEFISSIRKYRRSIYPDRNSMTGRFIDSYNSEILFNIQKARFEENVKLIEEFETELSELNEHEKAAEYYYLASNSAYTLFISNNYESCRRWLNIALGTGSKVISYRASSMVIILNLLLSYEQKEYDILESGMLSALRYFRNKNRLFRSEKLILDFIRNTQKNIPDDVLIENFEMLRLKLIKISNDTDEKKALEPLDIISWLESKTCRKLFIEILRQKAAAIQIVH